MNRWARFEKMRVANSHIGSLPLSILGRFCPYYHYNLVSEWPTWNSPLVGHVLVGVSPCGRCVIVSTLP